MDNLRIAIPSENPGGLDARLGAHFGHCEVYTLINIINGEMATVQVIPNVPHVQGGCMAPVSYLAQQDVNTMIAGGMGMRPLLGFQQVGIDVFHGGQSQTVRDAVDALFSGMLLKFNPAQTCGGGEAHSSCAHE